MDTQLDLFEWSKRVAKFRSIKECGYCLEDSNWIVEGNYAVCQTPRHHEDGDYAGLCLNTYFIDDYDGGVK